ncbi:MAG: hypothetical protein Q4G03_02810 [Planctomycetia bacterium]|nr:hypothetical protein [Planctomycetia bacterium]
MRRYFNTFNILLLLACCSLFALYRMTTPEFCQRLDRIAVGSTMQNADTLNVRLRRNGAAVLDGSVFLPRAKLYWITQDEGTTPSESASTGEGWRLRQIIDFQQRLRGRYPSFDINVSSRGWNDASSVAFNDHWLVLGVSPFPARKVEKKSKTLRGNVLIYHKDPDGYWAFHCELSPRFLRLDPQNLILTDDDLLLVPFPKERSGKTLGVIRSYRLTDSGVQPVDALRIPLVDRAHSSNGTRGFVRFTATKDWLFVLHSDATTFDDKGVSVYARRGDAWRFYRNCLADDIISVSSSEVFLSRHDPTGHGYFDRYLIEQNDLRLDASGELTNSPYPKLWEDALCLRSPNSYGFCWQGKYERFGLVAPEPGASAQCVSPTWLVDDADPETMALAVEAFKSRKYPRNRVSLRAHVYYEYRQYVPTVDYALCDDLLLTSYVFKERYSGAFTFDTPSSWAGVSLYRLSADQAPRRVFGMSTRKLALMSTLAPYRAQAEQSEENTPDETAEQTVAPKAE